MRKEVIVKLVDDGVERTFKIVQMPAVKQERWINKLVTMLLNGRAFDSVNFGELSAKFETGDYGVIMEVLSGIDYAKAEPLYNELMECVEYMPDPLKPFTQVMNADSIGAVITDFRNLYKLRWEVLKLNFGFFGNGVNSPTQSQKADIRITKTT